MRVLVTGGAGFIGRHLVRALVDRGDDVVVLDDLSTGRPDALASTAFLIEGDVRDANAVERATDGVDLAFHLAAAVGPALVAEDPAGTWSRNVLGTAVLLDACASRGVKALVLSTSEVYGTLAGDPTRAARPLSEDESLQVRTDGRRDVYAVSKLAAEAYALALHRAHGLPVTVVRPFNVVGPGQLSRYGMVLARFADAVVRGQPLPVYGDGSQRRCFLHVHDAVDALLALAGCSAAEGAVVNLGSDDEVTVLELAHRVCRIAGVAPAIEHIPFAAVYGEGFRDPPLRRPDLARVRALIGFAPRRTLDDAVRDALGAARGAAV